MLVAASIIVFSGIPDIKVKWGTADVGIGIDVVATGTVAHAHNRELHACNDDDVITKKIFDHALSHCSWWQWAILIGALITAFAAIAALIAGSGGTFLGLGNALWAWIAAGGAGATAVIAVIHQVCGANKDAVCKEEEEEE